MQRDHLPTRTKCLVWGIVRYSPSHFDTFRKEYVCESCVTALLHNTRGVTVTKQSANDKINASACRLCVCLHENPCALTNIARIVFRDKQTARYGVRLPVQCRRCFIISRCLLRREYEKQMPTLF